MTAPERKKTADNPSKKLGVKYLDDAQLANSFPDWKALMQRIEEQRQFASCVPRTASEMMEYHYPQMYDNIYAILGGRGTGKSSVILTLQNKLKMPAHQDILLPIITPEIISEKDCSILGWIMSATESVVSELELRLQRLNVFQLRSNTCLDGFFRDCQFQKENPLRKRYRELFKKSIIPSDGLDMSGYSAEDAIGFKAEQSRRQYKLLHELNVFWQQLTDCWYQVNKEEAAPQSAGQDSDSLKRPLIIVMFDDIDLVPERSMELLTTTFQYFTNPNIVILLTAAEKLLRDVIRLKLLERMVGSDSSSLMLDVLPDRKRLLKTEPYADLTRSSSVERMVREFYDKVIPPSSRYKLRRYQTISEKLMYSYSQIEQSFTAPQGITAIPIDVFLANQIELLRAAFESKGGSNTNFLYSRKDKETFRKAFLNIFGDKSRSIANGCLAIMNTVTRLTQLAERLTSLELNEEDNQEILQSVRYLAQILITSRPELDEFAGQINYLLKYSPDQQRIIVNYEAVMERYEQEKQSLYEQMVLEEQPLSDPVYVSEQRMMHHVRQSLGSIKKKMGILITLLFFLEGMLYTMDNTRRHLHGQRVLNHLLNADAMWAPDIGLDTFPLFPQHQQVSDFLDDYPFVLEHLERYVGADIYSRQFAYDYLEDSFYSKVQYKKIKLEKILAGSLKMDREWVKTALRMMAVRYSEITLFEKDFLYFPSDLQDQMALFTFTQKLDKVRENTITHFLSAPNLLEESDQWLSAFRELTAQELNLDVLPANVENKFLNSTMAQPLVRWSDLYEEAERDYKRLMAEHLLAYTVKRWKTFVGKNFEAGPIEEGEKAFSEDDRCYAIVRFVDESMKTCFHVIRTQTDLYLTEDDLHTLQNCLRGIVNVTEELRKRGNILATALRQTGTREPNAVRTVWEGDEDVKVYPPTDHKGIRGGSGTAEEPGGEDTWRFPAAPLIDYLLSLRNLVLRQREEEGEYDIYDSNAGYLTLLTYLALYVRGNASAEEYKELVLPLSWCIIMDLKMLEYLMPYYYAAKIKISQDRQEYMETIQQSTRKGKTEESFDDKLKEFFVKISQGGNPLSMVMQEVRAELSKGYYRYLEERR